MSCEYIPEFNAQECGDFAYNPFGVKKLYIIEEDGKLKVYEANGLKLGRFIGYGKWNKNGGIDVKREIS